MVVDDVRGHGDENMTSLICRFQVIEVIRDPHDKPESKYNPDAGMSKEDEDKYKRLIEENKQLAVKIKEVRLRVYARRSIFCCISQFHRQQTFTRRWTYKMSINDILLYCLS